MTKTEPALCTRAPTTGCSIPVTARTILEGHIRHCVRNGIEHGDADQTIASFSVISFIIYRQIFCYFGGQGTKGLKAPVNGFQYLIGAGFHPAVKKIQTSMVLYRRYG